MKRYSTLLFLFFFSISLTADAQVFKNKKQKKVKKQKKDDEGSVFMKNGFEMYGQEVEEETTPKPTTPASSNITILKPTGTPASTPAPAAKKEQKVKSNIFKKDKSSKSAKTAAKSSKNKSSDVISVDLDGLYNVTMDTVVVPGKRTQLDFKTTEDVKYYYNQALLKLTAKDYETALVFLNKSLKEDPHNKELLQLRGNIHTELLKYKKAIKDFNKAIKIDNTDELLYYNLGATYMKNGDLKKALQAFNYALQVKPKYLLALQSRAAAYTMDENFEAAIRDYNQVLDQNTFFLPAFKGRGVAKSMLGRYEEAISDFTTIIELAPTDGMAYYYRALAYVSNNEVYRGCSDLDKAHQLNIPQAYLGIKELCR